MDRENGEEEREEKRRGRGRCGLPCNAN